MTRIQHASKWKAQLAAWGALLATLAVAAGLLLFGHSHEEKKEARTLDYSGPLPSDAEIRHRLTAEQYHVVRENGTESAFHNSYWDNHRTGLYVDIITGEPLFSSVDKFDSDNGRPNFSKPIANEHVSTRPDTSFDTQRTEVRASKSDSHLGHVFPDQKSPTGQRYTVNSAAMRFIPVEKLQEEGYRDFVPLFRAQQ
jgi:methionine-R-sulfoxide reductase